MLFYETEIIIIDPVLGKAYRNDDVNVRFTTFCHKKLFYRKRKILKGKSVDTDLTKSRTKLFNDANNLVSSRIIKLFAMLT